MRTVRLPVRNGRIIVTKHEQVLPSRRAALVRTGTLVGAAFLSRSGLADGNRDSPRIGVLVPTRPDSIFTQLLRQGLAEMHYVEGTTIAIEWRYFRDSPDQLRSSATELASAKVDLIVALGTPAARAAMVVTTTIPIVFVSGDPIAANLADSLAHPGRNATGVSILSPELTAKRLEYLHLVAPRARRVAYMMNSGNVLETRQYEEFGRAARALGLKPGIVDCRSALEMDAALAALQREPPDGLVISGHPLFLDLRAKVARAVAAIRRPAIFPYREYHDQTVLMSYGPNVTDGLRRVAFYVARVLQGAKASELPIEQSTKLDLVIDMRVARSMGINVPSSLLALADQVLQ